MGKKLCQSLDIYFEPIRNDQIEKKGKNNDFNNSIQILKNK